MTEEEKLAKEYADKRIGKVLENSTFPNSYWHRQDWENCKQDFLAGYKAKTDEINKIGLALQSDMDKTIEQNIALKKELNKANEWHYVKDGDLPKENEYIMIYSKLADNIAVGKRRCAGKIRKRCVYEWYFATYEGTYCLRDKDIIAWKEIDCKEIKENE